MKIGPLNIWQRMHANGTPTSSVNVASLHWPWSLTWRWSITKSEWYCPPGNQGFSFMRTHRGAGFNFHACFNSRWTGRWSIQTQPNMCSVSARRAAERLERQDSDY